MLGRARGLDDVGKGQAGDLRIGEESSGESLAYEARCTGHDDIHVVGRFVKSLQLSDNCFLFRHGYYTCIR